MNRIPLRLYQPSASSVESTRTETGSRDILPFRTPHRATVISGRFTPPAVRAQAIRNNSVCPDCAGADVEPLELEDGIISPRNHQPIPGTATIVGFHCNACGIEWPVYELTSRSNG